MTKLKTEAAKPILQMPFRGSFECLNRIGMQNFYNAFLEGAKWPPSVRVFQRWCHNTEDPSDVTVNQIIVASGEWRR